MRIHDRKAQSAAIVAEPRCECGCVVEQHDCISDTSVCLNTRCPEQCGQYRPQAAAADMFTSAPLPGILSPFCTSDGQYFANAEDARRAQIDLEERARADRAEFDRVAAELAAEDAAAARRVA